MKSKKILQMTTFLVAVMFTILLSSCTNDELTAPVKSESVSTVFKKELNILHTQQTHLNKYFRKTQSIKRQGGVIQLGDAQNGISFLQFMPGSVSKKVTVTFEWESEGLLMGGAEFSPHGIQFEVPVMLKLSYKNANLNGITEDQLKIWYYHEDTGYWEELPSIVNTNSKTVTTFLEHFSRYALAAD